MELVCSEKRLQKLISLTTFKHCFTYDETLNAIPLENKIIKFCKLIYIGKYIQLIYYYQSYFNIF